jgi:hypothetical protein
MDKETRKSLEAIIEYLYEDEQKNFEFDTTYPADNREEHRIFLDIQKVAEWLERTK